MTHPRFQISTIYYVQIGDSADYHPDDKESPHVMKQIWNGNMITSTQALKVYNTSAEAEEIVTKLDAGELDEDNI